MSETEITNRHDIGGNQPPQELSIQMETFAKELMDRAADLEAASKDPERLVDIETPEQEAGVIKFQKQVQLCHKDFEALRKTIKVPIDAQAQQVQDYFLPPIRMLDDIKDLAQGKLNTWMRAQAEARRREANEERLKAERRARAAAEAEAEAQTIAEQARAKAAQKTAKISVRAAEKKIANAGISRTGEGATASLQTHRTYQITNRMQIPMEYWILDEQKIAAAVRAGVKDIPGVEITETQEARVR